jgi:hypothetical protein
MWDRSCLDITRILFSIFEMSPHPANKTNDPRSSLETRDCWIKDSSTTTQTCKAAAAAAAAAFTHTSIKAAPAESLRRAAADNAGRY